MTDGAFGNPFFANKTTKQVLSPLASGLGIYRAAGYFFGKEKSGKPPIGWAKKGRKWAISKRTMRMKNNNGKRLVKMTKEQSRSKVF
ncbi:MAG: hypothetical protein LUC47_07205 [Clostridiales bacterium]|nr:hypothetical protein [Clostridiales bacterium]